MRNKKIIEGYEIKQNLVKRNYKKKEKWKFGEIILVMQSEANIEALMRITDRKRNSIRFMIDDIIGEIGRRIFKFDIGLTNDALNFKRAFEIAKIHSSYYVIAGTRVALRLKKLNIVQKTLNFIE